MNRDLIKEWPVMMNIQKNCVYLPDSEQQEVLELSKFFTKLWFRLNTEQDQDEEFVRIRDRYFFLVKKIEVFAYLKPEERVVVLLLSTDKQDSFVRAKHKLLLNKNFSSDEYELLNERIYEILLEAYELAEERSIDKYLEIFKIETEEVLEMDKC